MGKYFKYEVVFRWNSIHEKKYYVNKNDKKI